MDNPARTNAPLAGEAGDIEIHAMPGHLIRRLHQAATAIFDRETARRGFDLTSVQFAALAVIDARPGLDQATLAAAISYDRVTIGGVIDRLEAKGLVRREVDRGDRRSRRLHLEPAGKSVLGRVLPHVRQAQGLMLAGLSDRERVTLLRLLRKTLGAMADVSRTPVEAAPAAGKPQPRVRRL